jgi:hypothetical protein
VSLSASHMTFGYMTLNRIGIPTFIYTCAYIYIFACTHEFPVLFQLVFKGSVRSGFWTLIKCNRNQFGPHPQFHSTGLNHTQPVHIAVLSSPPPIPAGLARVLQDSSGLCRIASQSLNIGSQSCQAWQSSAELGRT